MMPHPPIDKLIYMFRYYENQAKRCFDLYTDIVDAYFMYDYNMEMAGIYEQKILELI